MTYGQLFLGLVAIVVATIVYRWQKQKDRENEVLRERRAAYADFIEKYSVARIAVVDAQHDFTDARVIDSHKKLLVSQKKLSVIASDRVLELTNDLQSRFLFQIDAASRMDHPYFRESYPDADAALKDFDEIVLEGWNKLIDEIRAEVTITGKK